MARKLIALISGKTALNTPAEELYKQIQTAIKKQESPQAPKRHDETNPQGGDGERSVRRTRINDILDQEMKAYMSQFKKEGEK